jgi:hypothetical protein
MRVQDQCDPLTVDSLRLLRAFVKIADAAERRKVIEFVAALARAADAASPPIAPR